MSTSAFDRLSAAVDACDLDTVRQLLAEGHQANRDGSERGTLLRRACGAAAPAAARIAVAELLLAAGADIRSDDAGATALHTAAAVGPLALVELLIRRGALEWQTDTKGNTPLHAATHGPAPDKAAIIELLDRPVIRDPLFRAAVSAIHRGDIATLTELLTDHG